METRIVRHGNSCAVVIKRDLLEAAEMQLGSRISVSAGNGLIEIKKVEELDSYILDRIVGRFSVLFENLDSHDAK